MVIVFQAATIQYGPHSHKVPIPQPHSTHRNRPNLEPKVSKDPHELGFGGFSYYPSQFHTPKICVC